MRRSPSRLLERARWLRAGMTDSEATEAEERLIVATTSFEPGPWSPPHPRSEAPLGYLILGGRVAAHLSISAVGAEGLELLGEGDIVRPWSFSGTAAPVPAALS